MFGFSRNIFRYNAINLLFRASRNVAKAAPRVMSRSLVTAAPKTSHFSKPLAFGIIGGLAAAAGIYAYADVTPLELTQSIDHTLLSVCNLVILLYSQVQHFVIFNKYVKKQ